MAVLKVASALLFDSAYWAADNILNMNNMKEITVTKTTRCAEETKQKKNEIKRNIIPMKIKMMKRTIGKRLVVIIKSSRTHSST